MATVHALLGISVTALFAAAAALGAWRWYRVAQSPAFWRLLRSAQGLLVAQVALGGLLLASGHHPHRLHVLYGLLPVAVSFVAEQLRIAAAQTVLDARGLEDAKAVGRLEQREQRSIVVAVLHRELGVMTAGALIVAVLLIRAATTSGL